MKNMIAFLMAIALGSAGVASAGMQGQGAAPDAKKPEYKEPNPGPYRETRLQNVVEWTGELDY